MDELYVYDKAVWHAEDCARLGQPPEYAGTHIGFFLGWLFDRGALHPEIADAFSADFRSFQRGEIGAGRLVELVGGAIASDMVSEAIEPFVSAYYDGGVYTDEYLTVFTGQECYTIADTQSNYLLVRDTVDRAYDEWRRDEPRRR